ncbi:MAG: PKD domain-containing protein [Chitinophagaceae bacterium]|nr:PKD domain-containing protein [Chitinophagaceae bacterium]
MAFRTHVYRFLVLFFLIAGSSKFTQAQCPPNIDFELGNFNNWECLSQSGYTGGSPNPVPVPPTPGRHDLLSNPPGNGNDLYGGFPKNCPNGSGHSIKIGNEVTGTTSDGVSYTFTIPATSNTFNLIYHYAIVLNDANHPANLQPRLVITVENVTDGTPLPCPLDPIVVNGSLPGFFTSPITAPNGSTVRCKDWAAASIKLDNLAGKTIKLTFAVSGCGLTNGSHFGYAYIDVNSECSSSFIGATYCPDDTFINVTGPFGYQTYTWWDQTFTTILGNTQVINFTPPPPPGTILKLVVNPYNGYGCIDTLTATLQDTLTIQSVAGPDRTSCNNTPVQLGAIPTPTYLYSWSPVTGLNNPAISNPIATPAITTEYILTTSHEGGGCVSRDTVMVFAAIQDSSIQLIGLNTFCLGDPQSALLLVQPADSIQWYRNNIAIPGATQTQYSPILSGTYYAAVFSFVGCVSTTDEIVITIHEVPVAAFLTDQVNQCYKDNLFSFTNTSTVSSGSLLYDWDFGDGNTATTANTTHTYATPGTYQVRMIATSANGCKDTSITTVQVYDMPVAGFTINLADQCFKNNQFVFTNTSTIPSGTMQYAWDLGDGTTATTPNVTHSYALPGTYNVRLVVTSGNNCVDDSTFAVTAFPTPVASFVLNSPVQQCFKDNQFVFTNTSTVFAGNLLYSWDMGNGNLFTTKDVTYTYPVPGNYTVKLLITAANGGCQDSTLFNITVNPTPVAGFTINQASQCFNNNQFIFTNTSTVFSGTLLYNWDLGDGTTATTANITHSYAQPGTYKVKLLVTATDGGCVDSSLFTVAVFAYPVADFLIQPLTCINLPLYVVNKTINTTTTTLDYLWEFGNGQTSTMRTPIYSYPAPGNYKIRLTTNITGCPTPVSVRELDIKVDAPVPGITYPEFDARYNFPELLHARQIGNTAIWSPATSLDTRFSYTPTFKGVNSQLYTIELKTAANGCITVDTQLVRTLKKIEIYVPTVFTPGGDGLNDLLRPLLFGFDHVNYFRVYNRWGKLLFQMKSDRPGWDGKINGQPSTETQTVVWMIEAVDVDGKLHRKQGTTVLMR